MDKIKQLEIALKILKAEKEGKPLEWEFLKWEYGKRIGWSTPLERLQYYLFTGNEIRIKSLPEYAPLGPEDIPPGSVIRSSTREENGSMFEIVTCSKRLGVQIQGRDCIKWDELSTYWEINRSLSTVKWEANAWEPCRKLKES